MILSKYDWISNELEKLLIAVFGWATVRFLRQHTFFQMIDIWLIFCKDTVIYIRLPNFSSF